MSQFNVGVVDVGIANIHYPASSLAQMQAYSDVANGSIAAFFNACGSAWGQKLVRLWF